MEAAGLKGEADRIRAKAAARQNARSRLQERLYQWMAFQGLTKQKAGVFDLAIQANGGNGGGNGRR